MKTKLIITIVLTIALYGCSAPRYLPKVKNIDVNQYGSYIKIYNIENRRTKGELIAIDSSKLVVLINKKGNKKIIKYPIDSIKRFTLTYAKPKQYAWTIPLSILASISHGVYGIISMPINMIVTIVVTNTGETDFQYKNKTISYKDLTMFARFPQGLPPNIDINKIK